ncbi:MAG: hypothetical protein KJ852_16730 [Gammaproteobacteria bacterium]|nr:hypothetical protein [Gammaproteobacteria bacterium]MBU0786869.1 hypothetical protein [Gammaproteobacteria bacterium]MBU0813925.1 hypothetical protein [Gammaproteobacteria bacterium]MBU1788602.1 hypothetical protein [Gammaproteobacteria bacterium]
MKTGPRALQYSLELSDEEIDQLVGVPPKQLDLSGVDLLVGAGLLEVALAKVVVPDPQTRDLLRQLIAKAQAHATANLDSDASFLKGIYSKRPWGEARRAAICLTGLQGVGKSELLLGLGRILSRQPGTFGVAGHLNIPLVPFWMVTLAKGDGLNELLRKYIDPLWEAELGDAKEKPSKNWSIPKLLGLAQHRSWLNATCLAVVDEFQWIAASISANARAASVLLKLHGIGPLLVYCANFSLGHKLILRPPEEHDRLLSRPLIMKPFSPESPEFTAYLAALQQVAPDLLTFDLNRDAEQVYLYTYGIRRKMVDLLVAAYQISCRKGGRGTVGAQELLQAYRSELYLTHRGHVEVLFRQQVTGRMEQKNLWCPFGSMDPVRSNVKEAVQIVQAFEKRTEDALLDAALTPSEAAAAAAIKPEMSRKSRPATVIRFQRGKVTKEDLLAGAASLDNI